MESQQQLLKLPKHSGPQKTLMAVTLYSSRTPASDLDAFSYKIFCNILFAVRFVPLSSYDITGQFVDTICI